MNMDKEELKALCKTIYNTAAVISANISSFYLGNSKLEKKVAKKTAKIQALSLEIKRLLKSAD